MVKRCFLKARLHLQFILLMRSRYKIANVNTLQFKCNFSATRCDIFDLARNLSHLAAIFAIKLNKKTTVPPLHSCFFGEQKWWKKKQNRCRNLKRYAGQSRRKSFWWSYGQTTNDFIKQTVQSLKEWTNGNHPFRY